MLAGAQEESSREAGGCQSPVHEGYSSGDMVAGGGGGSGGQRAAGRRNTLKVGVYNLRLCMFVTKARCCITERRLRGWQ